MAEVRFANCKICGKEYSYSLEWARALEAQGRQPTEYCPECRKWHSKMRNTLAMPYFKPKPTGPRKAEKELKGGRLGRLTHVDRNHRTISIPASFHLPNSDIDFGIKDPDIRELFQMLEEHRVTVVVGPTGSGKSTFLPYRLIAPPSPYQGDHFTRYGQVVVTQPRIQATRTIPEFVARDLYGSPLGAGSDIGFIHRGEKAADRHAKLVFCTDGMLINWIIDGRIADFSVIMIDEAHERSLNIDLILGLLKIRLPFYPNLKLIIASATINAALFKGFFDAPDQETGLINFEGKKKFDYEGCPSSHKISEQPHPDYLVPAVVDRVAKILLDVANGQRESQNKKTLGQLVTAPEGDILAFLPTVSSIDKAANGLRLRIKEDRLLCERGIEVHVLHRQVPLVEQDLALQKKSKAITLKVIKVLDEIFKRVRPDGDILALALDDRSAVDIAKKLSDVFGEDKRFAGTGVRQNGKSISTPHWEQEPLRIVEIATYDQAPKSYQESFPYVIHDRRVVISTNVAETSLTVDGIVYVVDSGLILQKNWDLETWTESFRVNWHSQDGCRQRWGRAGRVRDGYAYALYTTDQFNHFDLHTLPEIQRAPLEAVVLKAKLSGVDDVVNFPWIEPPNRKEIDRAIEVLMEHGLLDTDGDLTEHGQVVSSFAEEPNTGHLLVLADQTACAMEVATLIPFLGYKLRGGVLRWQHQWDGHTRRLVRRIHTGLKAGCQDDLAFLLKLFQGWSDAFLPEYDWLTDAIFPYHWVNRIPLADVDLKKSLGEEACLNLIEAAKDTHAEIELREIVKSWLPNPLVENWLQQAIKGMRDARRAAWARRFFVNHATMVKVDAARQEILEKLSIGKKLVESRPLGFDILMDRVRLVMACAWPDRIYVREPDGYRAFIDRTRKLESAFDVQISSDSIMFGRENVPDAFVCCKRTAGSGKQKPLYVGLLVSLKKDWLPIISNPLVQVAQWAAESLVPKYEPATLLPSERIFLDLDYPLMSRYACRQVDSLTSKEIELMIAELISPPTIIEETSQEGVILYAEDPADAVGDGLDERAGLDPDIIYQEDPEAEDPKAGLELEEDENLSSKYDQYKRASRQAINNQNIRGIYQSPNVDWKSDIPCEVVGYPDWYEDPPRLRLVPSPDPSSFDHFTQLHPPSTSIKVRAIEVDQELRDRYAALVVKPLDTDLEIVMEANELTFAGRYSMLASVPMGTIFSAQVEKIDLYNHRIFLSVLPYLENYLPEEGQLLEGIVEEITENGSLHVSLDKHPVGDLPLSLSAYVENNNIPESIRQAGKGARLALRISYETEREIKLPSLTIELAQELQKDEWQGRVGWSEEGRKLWARGRLSYNQRETLLTKVDQPYLRRAIEDLYRFSNMLNGRIEQTELLHSFIAHNPPGSIITSTVKKTLKHDALVELSDGILGKVDTHKARNILNHWLKEGEEVEVIVGELDPKTGYVSVKIASPSERIRKNYPEGSVHRGLVTKVVNYGAFIRLAPGIDGLVHQSKLRWGTGGNPINAVREGETVTVGIESITNDGKLNLTMRIPENRPEKCFEIGSLLTGEVIHLLETGALVRLAPGQIGMIHISELSWKMVSRPDQIVSIGKKVNVRVLSIHSTSEESRISLSLKQAYSNVITIKPWQVRTLIGEGGKTIRDIQQKTDTRIFAEPNGKVEIKGSTIELVNDTESHINRLFGKK